MVVFITEHLNISLRVLLMFVLYRKSIYSYTVNTVSSYTSLDNGENGTKENNMERNTDHCMLS